VEMAFVSNEGLGHLVSLPRSTRAALADSFLGAFEGFSQVIETLLRSGSQDQSLARTLGAEVASLQLETMSDPIEEVIELATLGCLSGLDHARALAVSLKAGGTAFGIVTLARGCIEAFARSWWILAPSDPKDLVARALSAQASELSRRLRLNPDEQLIGVSDGKTVLARSRHEQLLRDIVLVTSTGKPIAIDYTSMASEFGDVFSDNGRRQYALLSTVAHGEALGIADFVGVTTGTRTPHFVVGLPAWLAQVCAESSFKATSFALGRLTQLTQVVDDESPPPDWMLRHDSALRVMQEERKAVARLVARSRNSYEWSR